MEITDVRVKLLRRRRGAEKLRAYCTVTLDGVFVVRDIKVIEGARGVFVAMPSRRLTDRCPRCRHKNHLRARHCNECGAPLRRQRGPRTDDRRTRLHVDVAHPINAEARRRFHDAIIGAFRAEELKAKDGDYEFAEGDDFEDFDILPPARESEASEGGS